MSTKIIQMQYRQPWTECCSQKYTEVRDCVWSSYWKRWGIHTLVLSLLQAEMCRCMGLLQLWTISSWMKLLNYKFIS